MLPEVLDLAAAESLLLTVRQRLSDEQPLVIDASAVEILTLPCIQVLLAAMREGNRVSIENPSIEFATAFEDLGINWVWGLEYSQDQDHTRKEISSHQTVYEDGVRDEAKEAGPENIGVSPLSKRILTIDDSKTMRDMLMVTLAQAGFDVLQAIDGKAGIDVLINEKVDVVITDINMPRMDGYEVIRHLRGNPNHKTTPILVLTTESEIEKKELAREAGATGWMVKPFDPDRLIATVRKVAP